MKKRKKLIILLITLIIIALLLLGIYTLFNNFNSQEIVVLHEIDGYGYKLEDRDTDLYVSLYKELEDELDKEEINFDKYAELIAKLYIIDLYTLDNKISKYDVGGTEFVYNNFVDNYNLKVTDTMYSVITIGHDEELPEVTGITMNSIEEYSYDINEVTYNGYKLSLSWGYKKDLEYDINCELIIINDENKLYIVEQLSEE